MPQYLYRNPKTGETKEVVQSIHDKHEYSEDGINWERVFLVPQAATDTKIDPMSARDFIEKTGRKKGTMGDMFDMSKEASLKRKDKMGKDPLKEKHLEDWSKKRKGRKPPGFINPD
jgi:hypothetical protein